MGCFDDYMHEEEIIGEGSDIRGSYEIIKEYNEYSSNDHPETNSGSNTHISIRKYKRYKNGTKKFI